MTPSKTKELALKIEDVSIAFGGLKAVDNLSFAIERHEIFGLIGPNGAGKTTIFNCITQFYKADSGSIHFINAKGKETDLMDLSVHEIIDEGIVRTFQNVELIRELSIMDNVLIGAHHVMKQPLLGQLFNRKAIRKDEAESREKAEKILAFLDIEHLKDLIAGSQPYGVQKKVEIARTLMSDPELIILDEPAAGLNDTETKELAMRIKQIRETYQTTILLVEHDMRLVMDICDHICAISFGKRIAVGTPKEIQSNPEVQKAYLGEEGELE
ncbi:amino acid/amide ABC transporter ATP-binding protein 1, HAAT family (TC 3.A.1.4.-) [Alkalibacterium putridalgicola]|uniref:ABC transporter ATP-binding protein n=1 Tax=Alkalibacterium putridalgicola TaxID=426703 RepID=A0A1H7VX47_9LACT|nr:ABC transporter ATP-binding protein [Alkalibacterium putridalgicola]GEK89375.1 ABC transporter ATP-binding protein [Alkalibacterium putridalgicola]SEM13811.1 amino acid/amide ABC transporter ATP-binding protein 1, HAAT family (TC 3.A.1.4.-) [Alkalibacterium putridalgicola]